MRTIMNFDRRTATIGLGLFVALAASLQSSAAQDVLQAHTVVTVNTKSAETVTDVPQQNVSVFDGRKLQQVTGWVPLRGQRAGLQLVVLLDDSSRGNLGLQLNELKSFITALPPDAEVAVGYMRNGAPNLVEGFSKDHAQAAKGVRLPTGNAGINGSPWFCLTALVKQWPGGDSNVRREVIMVTDGVDRYSGARYDPEDPYVQAAVTEAQKAGVIVYSIYYKSVGRLDQNALVVDGGQNYLTQISHATGGKVYLEGLGNPVSFAPFLSDIQRKLQNQYELSFDSTARAGLQSFKVKTTQPNTTLDWPARIPVGNVAGTK